MQNQQPFHQDSRGFQSIRVEKLMLFETGTYNPMYSRPYKTFIGGIEMDNIVRRVEEANGASITGTLMAGVASNIVAPDATPHGEIAIPYGWAERRIRFLAEVHVNSPTGSAFIYHIQGYTSHLGVSQTGAIDPRMEFIINSFTRLSRVSQYGPNGLIAKDVVTESAQIINGKIHSQLQPNTDGYRLRPSDIFRGVGSSYLANTYSHYNNEEVLDDTSIRMNGESFRSARANNLPSNYVASIIDNYQTSINLADFGQQNQHIYTRAIDLTHESSPLENMFIRAISNVKGIPNATSFTIGDLEKIDPNVRHVTNYVTTGPTRQSILPTAGQTAYWSSSDRETLVATVLSNSLPAIMMDLMISKIAFRSTNHDYGGNMNTVIIQALSLANIDLTGNFDLFRHRFEREIMFDITYGNQDTYMVDVDCNLFGDSTISVSIGTGQMIPFTTPSFCDSLLSPVVTNSKDNFFGIVHDFETLMNEVSDINRYKPALNTYI